MTPFLKSLCIAVFFLNLDFQHTEAKQVIPPAVQEDIEQPYEVRREYEIIYNIHVPREETPTYEPPEGTDCTDIFAKNVSIVSRAYAIQPDPLLESFKVFCDMKEDGWTVIQRRNGKGVDGKPVNFGRKWAAYQRGFGEVQLEHWLGLDKIHALTHQPGKSCSLLIEMISCDGKKGHAYYDTFHIGNSSELYRIHLGNYSGNVGDAFRGDDRSANQDGHPFSTFDNDNDDCESCQLDDMVYNNCASFMDYSGWWYSNCGLATLNAEWHPPHACVGSDSAVYWGTWSRIHSLMFTELKVKCISG